VLHITADGITAFPTDDPTGLYGQLSVSFAYSDASGIAVSTGVYDQTYPSAAANIAG